MREVGHKGKPSPDASKAWTNRQVEGKHKQEWIWSAQTSQGRHGGGGTEGVRDMGRQTEGGWGMGGAKWLRQEAESRRNKGFGDSLLRYQHGCWLKDNEVSYYHKQSSMC